MPIRTKTYLKQKFESGDKPTQEDFHDLIDSSYNNADSAYPLITPASSGKYLKSYGVSADWEENNSGGTGTIDYILDCDLEGTGLSIDNPYIAGNHGESRLILRSSLNSASPWYIKLPSFPNSFIDDQVYQIDTSIKQEPCFIFIDPNTVQFNRATIRYLTNREVGISGDDNDSPYQGYVTDSMIHYTFEAYPTKNAWVPVDHNALLLQASYDGGDGCWGNDVQKNSKGILCRYTLSQQEYNTDILKNELVIGNHNYLDYLGLDGGIEIPRGYRNIIITCDVGLNPTKFPLGVFQLGDEVTVWFKNIVNGITHPTGQSNENFTVQGKNYFAINALQGGTFIPDSSVDSTDAYFTVRFTYDGWLVLYSFGITWFVNS